MPLADIQIRGADFAQQTSSPSSFRMGDSSDDESDNETPKRPPSRTRLPAISPLPILRPLTPDMESPLPSPPRQRPIRKTLDNRIMIGDYLVSDAIQSGCWGELKLGTHQITGEQVCLKFVASGCDKCAQSNLTNEVANLRRCHHPNIVQVLEVIAVSDDTLLKFDGTVLVMEFYPRGDLLEYIENGQVMDEDLARYIFRELLQVVAFCHERRVAHLDIKPEHVVFDAEYNLRLVDFGHSCCYKGNSMRTFAHRGTIPFMAPEVLVCNSSMGDIETSNGYEILPHLTPLKHSHPSCHMHDAEMSDSSPAASACRVERKSGSGRHSPARAASPVPVLDLPVTSESSHCPAVQCVEDDFTSAAPRAGVTRRSSVSRHCPQCSWKLELPPSPRRKQLEHLFQESYDGCAADVWSCGVLLCTLVFGSHPFEHAHHSDMRYVIFCKNPKAFWTQFARENKVQISSTLQSLLSAMMAPKSCKRASIAQVLEHPWFTAPTLSREQFRRVMSRRYAHNHPTPKMAAPPCATPAGPAALVTPVV